MSQVLRHLPVAHDVNLLVGLNTSDDAAVYKLNEQQAIIQTVDFFTPMVDNPYLFGQIAAANALSDVYAMGGQPLLALNIVCFPDCLSPDILVEILRGGADKVTEAGGIIVGGHTIRDDEPKYGLSVTGLASPAEIISNEGAHPGDLLVLTKPIGSGVINTALKANLPSPEAAQEALQNMAALNKTASIAMRKHQANACTDITGFGLLGHAAEMAAAGGVSLEICCSSVPLLPEALSLAAMGIIPAGAYNNREHLKDNVSIDETLPQEAQMLLFDPQTSGGLLIALDQSAAEELVKELTSAQITAAIIGKVLPSGEKRIYVY